jgi:dTDP-4-dehydrorhamnose reductase
MRYFRCEAGDALYEEVRAALDHAWGHPTPDGQTATCISPAAVAPRDSQGRILLAVNNEFCEFDAAAAMLPQLLASGAVEEIDEATYRAAMPTPAY